MPDQIITTDALAWSVERPVLRYPGGKWRIADWVISHFPEHDIYVEPYGGAASVLMRKPPARAEVYNDLNGDIVNVFRILRDEEGAKRLCCSLELTPFVREEYDLSFEQTEDMAECARRTIVRSFMGYNVKSLLNGKKNGWRSRRLGSFWPASDWQNYPLQIRAFVERLHGVTVESRPAFEVLKRYDSPVTLHYVDPPYLPETRSANSRNLYKHELSKKDHIELAETLKSLEGMVILSGYDSRLYTLLYPGWRTEMKKNYVSSHGERTEVLYISPNTLKKVRQKDLWESGEIF